LFVCPLCRRLSADASQSIDTRPRQAGQQRNSTTVSAIKDLRCFTDLRPEDIAICDHRVSEEALLVMPRSALTGHISGSVRSRGHGWSSCLASAAKPLRTHVTSDIGTMIDAYYMYGSSLIVDPVRHSIPSTTRSRPTAAIGGPNLALIHHNPADQNQ
jgi:hypothetical protein